MKTIRFGTFETNSSSEHSVSLYNADEIKDFREGREYYDSYSGFTSVESWKEDLKEKKKTQAEFRKLRLLHLQR